MYLISGPKNTNGKHFGHMFVEGQTFTRTWLWKELLESIGFKATKISENDNVKRILLIHYNVGIGDMLFITPILRGLKEKYPKALIEVFANYPSALVLQNNTHATKVNSKFPSKYIMSIVDEYDEVFDTSDFARQKVASEYTNIYDMYCDQLDIHPSSMSPVLNILQEEKNAVIEYISQIGIDITKDKIVVIQAHSTSVARSWPIERTKQLAIELNHLGYKVVITGDRDRLFSETGKKELEIPKEVVNLIGALDLRALITLISLSYLVIGPDSSGYHIAEALGVNSIPLFSLFDPYLRVKYYKHCYPIYKPLPCSPCLCHSQNCPSLTSRLKYTSPCMEAITVNDVLNKIKEIGVVPNDIRQPNKIIDKNCPVCESTQKKVYCRKGNLYYYKCNKCALLYTDRQVDSNEERIETCKDIYKWIKEGDFTFVDADRIFDNTSLWLNAEYCGKYHYILSHKSLEEICNRSNLKIEYKTKDKEHFSVQLVKKD
jgi:ADP-heptose:LPS heptosyltransferase